ncbi:MAG: ABC-F family ATP-binding cassette domain-containing protein [Bacteroidales bacterium]
MNYLSVENLSKSYGEKRLFQNLNFGIEKGQKVALIAKNGTGKTTLLNIITQKDIADEGRVVFRKDLRVSYLPQNPIFNPEQSIIEVLFDTENAAVSATREYEHALALLKKEDSIEHQMLLEKAMARMEASQAWNYEEKVKEVLSRLQLNDVEQKIKELSGGQRKKVALSKVLIEDADLLILDEPTNHLDIEMTEWLEEFLSRQNLALLLVTHDRCFLDAVCSEILEIDHYKMFSYKGNYNYFLEKKAERELIERAEIEKAQNLYRRELDWMRRMPSARATKAKARKDAFYEVKEKASQKLEQKAPELSVRTERIGGKILEVYNLSKKYDSQVCVADFSYIFKKGDKIGIMGQNGVGKSTFLNLITGKVKPDSGSVVVGQTIKFGYYHQEGLQENEDRRVIDIIKDVAEFVKMDNGDEISASQFLTYFQFDATTQYNYFSNLSGGERRRLYLLKTLMANPNFLILDEPTNDLDIFTLMLLEDFLSHYQGCLIVVSHDRSFMDNLVDHLFVFEGEGKIKDYYGNYTDYKKSKSEKDKQIQLAQKQERIQQQSPEVASTAKIHKRTYKEQKEYEDTEAKITILETEKQEIEQQLSSGQLSNDQIINFSSRMALLIGELDVLENRWLALSID